MRTFVVALTLLTGACSMTGTEAGDRGYFSRSPSPASGHSTATPRSSEDSRIARITQSLHAASVELCRGAAGPAAAAAPAAGCAVPIFVMPSGSIAASTNGQRVRITSGFVDFAANDDELAFVVAHELAHVVLRHQLSLGDAGRRTQEQEADTLGLYIAMRAGYDGRAAVRVLPRLAGYLRNDAGDSRYPGFAEREQRLLAQLERLKALAAAAGTARRQLAAAAIVAEVVGELVQ